MTESKSYIKAKMILQPNVLEKVQSKTAKREKLNNCTKKQCDISYKSLRIV